MRSGDIFITKNTESGKTLEASTPSVGITGSDIEYDILGNSVAPAGPPKEGLEPIGDLKIDVVLKTAVCISGRLVAIENYENVRKHILEPYNADVFIDTWIPFRKNTMKIARSEDINQHVTIYPEEIPADINQFVEVWKPKAINLEFFDGMPLTHQVRSVLPKNKMTQKGFESPGTNTENVVFMYYKIWKCNQLRKTYEQINRIRYDRIIRLRFDNTFDSFPMIEPKFKTVYIPHHGDYCGGICDQVALADSQTMDLYCELYNDIYRYSTANIGVHPESLLRRHLEINRIAAIRFACGMKLRGLPI
jgi:hypothetical protein